MLDHAPTSLGRAFLVGGAGLGLLLLAALYTHGFGLLGAGSRAAAEAPGLVHRPDGTTVVPEGSALRQQLKILAAPVRQVGAQLVLPALIEAQPTRSAQILTPLAGQVMSVNVTVGDRVRRGQVLATLRSGDAAQAYAEDEKAADTLRLARRNRERQEQQFKLGTASQRDLDQARSDHNQAVAEYARTQARLQALNIAPPPPDGSRLLQVRAPFDGAITTLSAAPGAMVNDATLPLMSIANLAEVWVTALAAEKDLPGIATGQDAEIALTAWPGRILHGKVQVVTDVVEADTRRSRVRIALANGDYALKPNMFATVTVHGAARTRVVLPTAALLMNNDRTSVFVVTAPWTFARRYVEPLLEEGDSVALDKGLAPGEPVVVQGGILLND